MTSGVMTVRELAAYLRVHQSTIYRLLRESDMPAFKVGSDWRFVKTAIDEWMINAIKGQTNGLTLPRQRLRAAK